MAYLPHPLNRNPRAQKVPRGQVPPVLKDQVAPVASNLGLDPNKANRVQHQGWHLLTHLKLALPKQEHRTQIWVQCHRVNQRPVSLTSLWEYLTKRWQAKELSLPLLEKVQGV